MLRFICPNCHAHLEAPERKAGKQIACPRCRQGIEIQAPASAVTVACPGCGRAIPLRLEELALSIQCASCDAVFVPARGQSPQGVRPKRKPGPPGVNTTPHCSCPHCGQTKISFEMDELESVLQCAKCKGFFTPLGGKYEPSERQPLPNCESVRELAPVVKLAPQAILSEPVDSPIVQKASQFLTEAETIWAMIPGRALEKITEIQSKGSSSGLGIGFGLGGGIGVGVGSSSMSGRSKMKQAMERQGGLLTHYLVVTDRQMIFWMRGIFSELLGSGPEADQLDISSLRGIEQRQRLGTTTLTFHFEFGDKYFATTSEWAGKLQKVLREFVRKP